MICDLPIFVLSPKNPSKNLCKFNDNDLCSAAFQENFLNLFAIIFLLFSYFSLYLCVKICYNVTKAVQRQQKQKGKGEMSA